MKKPLLLLLLIISTNSFSQIKDGQNFCVETADGDYFSLSIDKKKIIWADNSYVELKNDTKTFNGKIYIEYTQDWGDEKIDKLYLREEEGVVYQYLEELNKEVIRYDKNFKKGHSWNASGKGKYTIISYDGKLHTRYCDYENLLVIKAKIDYGTFNFYYLKGHGYIGATTMDNKLISFITPQW
ncbi:MAG: hypothetical protein V4548_07920 [Bacteroidota bacterium]